MRPIRLLAAFSTALLLGTLPAAAQLPVVHLNGNVYDGAGGPFVQGIVYHILADGVASGATVPAGETLTILPGAIVKLDSHINVVGTMLADGATFTSWFDDGVGGDSNGDGGSSLPFPGTWNRIEFLGPNSVVQDCAFVYGGSGGTTLWFRSIPVTLRRSAVAFSAGNGIDLGQSASTVEDVNIVSCGGRALTGGWFGAVELLTDITAIDNAGGNYAHFLGGSGWTGTLHVRAENSANQNGVHVLETFAGSGSSPLQVSSGAELILDPGTTLKFVRGKAIVNGTLTAQGTAEAPVVFTSLEDDTHAGDTNLDGGATQPAPGDWDGVVLQNGADASHLAHTKIFWGGTGSTPALQCSGSGGTFTDCEVAHALGDGFAKSFGSGGSPAALVGCLLRDNGGLGMSLMRWTDLEASRDNVLQNNGGGEHVTVQGGTQFAAVDGLTPASVPGTLVLYDQHTLTAGSSLTIPPGTVLKLTNTASILANPGRLRLLGTGANPIVITSIEDDSIGGDTNGNGGATLPAPGDWGRINIGGAGCVLEYAHLRYGGRNSSNCLDVNASDTLLRAVQVGFALNDGIEIDALTQNVLDLVVHDCGHDGLFLRSGTFDVLHATVADNGGAGMRRWFQGGAVWNSISWNNAEGNFVGLPSADVHSSNGDFAGQNGNLAADPVFEGTSAFDFRLSAGSPCLGAAHFGKARAVAADADEGSRISDHALVGVLAADMGAFERAAFTLTSQGAPRLGQSLAFTLQGTSGFGLLFLGYLDQSVLLRPFGMELAGVSNVRLFGGTLTPGVPRVLTIPNDPLLIGADFGIQALGLISLSPQRGNFTNLYRASIY